ncbi:hypothetical protein [Streptomyces osmaniensis]|uniref:Secreted protein n=1 Tax=Streptomyces osmaniensis TaxID=593134 RepID=A0ABP6Z688_9ACTN
MKTFTTRSAALAACTALLLAATGGQASADANDEPAPYRLIVVKGDKNNVAGNDLHLGNNNTSGTGHSIGQPQSPADQSLVAQGTVNVFNCTGSTLTLSPLPNNPRTNGEWLSPQATPPARIASHPATLDGNQCISYGVSANWTSATTVAESSSTAIYDLETGGRIEFDIEVASYDAGVGADCPRGFTTVTCDWITSVNETAQLVAGVVNFIIVPGA